MKSMVRPSLLMYAPLLLSLVLASCAAGTRLRTEAVSQSDIRGTFRLYLYGCRHPKDLETMALIVDEQVPEQIELYVSATSYRVREHVPAEEALRLAAAFFACSIHDRGQTVMRRIVSASGRTLAYELKPLYERLEFGKDEVLLSTYSQTGSRVTVYLQLDPQVDRTLRDAPASAPPGL
jgi:hypothetical protein